MPACRKIAIFFMSRIILGIPTQFSTLIVIRPGTVQSLFLKGFWLMTIIPTLYGASSSSLEIGGWEKLNTAQTRLFFGQSGLIQEILSPDVQNSALWPRDPIQPQPAKVNINRATAAELEKLPGIGPKLAQKIVNYRSQNPPFRKVEELLIIQGVNRRLLEKIRPYITVQ
jgi:competence ComEA-like helix-hairpin-helix protein